MNAMPFCIYGALLSSLLVTIAGCKMTTVTVGFYNDSRSALSDVHALCGDSRAGAGILIPYTETTDGPMPLPLADTARVVWITAHGHRVEKDVPFGSLIKDGFDGFIYFRIIDGREVRIVVLTHDDWWNGHDGPAVWRAEARKAAVIGSGKGSGKGVATDKLTVDNQ